MLQVSHSFSYNCTVLCNISYLFTYSRFLIDFVRLMATCYLQEEVIPTSSDTPDTSISDVFSVREAEIHSHFNMLDNLLKDRRKRIVAKLREKRSEFEKLETGRLTEIKEIENVKSQMMNASVTHNKVNVLRDETIKIYDNALAKLRTPVQPPKIIFDKLTDEFNELVGLMGLMFVGEDYKTLLEPVLSLNSDDIISSIRDMKKIPDDEEQSNIGEDHLVEPVNVRFGKIAVDSKTNRLFAINTESKNILVFDLDGNFISCFGENNETLNDLSIDNENNCIFAVSDEEIVKFNLTDYEVIASKQISSIENVPITQLAGIDIHEGQLYTCAFEPYLLVLCSDLEFIRSINVVSCLNTCILCRNENLLVFSIFPPQINILSYNGDLVRNVSLHCH